MYPGTTIGFVSARDQLLNIPHRGLSDIRDVFNLLEQYAGSKDEKNAVSAFSRAHNSWFELAEQNSESHPLQFSLRELSLIKDVFRRAIAAEGLTPLPHSPQPASPQPRLAPLSQPIRRVSSQRSCLCECIKGLAVAAFGAFTAIVAGNYFDKR